MKSHTFLMGINSYSYASAMKMTFWK